MNDSMIERSPNQPSIEINPSVDALLAVADITVSKRFRGLIPEKAKQVAKKVIRQTALSTSALFIILSSGCGNTEEIQPQTTPESTPISVLNLSTPTEIPTPISTIPVSEPTPIPTSISIPKPDTTSTPIPPKSTENPKPPTESPKTTEYRYMDVSDNIKVAIDKEGLPVKYIVSSTNEQVYFDTEEIRKLREKAISSKEPEIVKMFLQKNPASVAEFTYKESEAAKHPKTLELPKDVVSEEDLEMKGITILQPENTNLFIRKGAFAKRGILEDFNNEGGKLNIVFLNGSIITQKYLNDPKYAEIIDDLPKEFLSARGLRENKIAYAEKILEAFHREPPVGFTENEGLREVSFLELKADIYRYKEGNSMTDDQVAKEAGYFLGWYADKSLLHPAFKNTTPFLFLAVDRQSYSFPTIFFRHNGDVSIKNLKGGYRRKMLPATTQTHPDPDDFVMNPYASPENKDYVYPDNEHLGFVLRHELGHRALIEERVRRNEVPDSNEYSADIHAMQGIREAWENWKKSGHTDNSGYPFVFSLPKEQGGGYILTRKRKIVARKRRELRAKNIL